MAYYLDTSAFLKLLIAEPESAALRRWARRHTDDQVSSDLLRVEALRTARRISPRVLASTRRHLDTLPLLALDTAVCELAATLDPAILRTLDGLHLAAAMTFGDELDGIVTYDHRLQAAAALHGVEVLAPA